ncbi:terpene synthase family protein [Streptomyces minutiscleroticus]|uniref:Terpene synthase n=1 Tax=Streptomyces minutiscleroticus TaxID=68238 RepID=A0A918P0E7_9ACTN|nr:hypothetical protein [Streptomyces minutiscleroticus]GGY09866.1 hypothetical protein GCM10010358_73170 [Streptomyces minutiscleroticus]
MTTTSLTIPPFYCPIEPAVHPAVDEVARRATEWIDRFGFCPSETARAWTLGSASAEFYGRFAPDAHLEPLVLAACWTYWAFTFDDVHCDEGELRDKPAEFAAYAGHVQRALETPGPQHYDDPFTAAIHDLGESFRACASPTQVRRFIAAHRAWLTGAHWQIANRARCHMPDLDEYVTMRIHASGGEPVYAMLEIANQAEIPAAELDSPAVCALTEMAILVAALDNDWHSLAKETAALDQTEQNVPHLLMHHHNRTAAEAATQTAALRDRILCRFLTLRERLRPHAGPALQRYLTDLGHGIRGNIDWALHVHRYLTASQGEIPNSAPAAVWSDHPSDSSRTPPPLPSISWWWGPFAPYE